MPPCRQVEVVVVEEDAALQPPLPLIDGEQSGFVPLHQPVEVLPHGIDLLGMGKGIHQFRSLQHIGKFLRLKLFLRSEEGQRLLLRDGHKRVAGAYAPPEAASVRLDVQGRINQLCIIELPHYAPSPQHEQGRVDINLCNTVVEGKPDEVIVLYANVVHHVVLQ